jgi:ribosomal protein S18 acetylase RimI-like enzyme
MENVIEIITYQQEHQPWFESLNRAWIEKYFWMEPVDFDVLQHPDKHIIQTGGTILMGLVDKQVAGTVALKFVKPGIYEFTKMAVQENFRGLNVGKKLAYAAIEEAKRRGAEKIILYSNTRLETAIALYRKIGFTEVPLDGPYKRSDIKMELLLDDIDLHIREASLADVSIIRQLGIKTFSDTFADSNTKEDMDAYLSKSFAPGVIESEFAEPATVFFLAFYNGEAVGYAKVRDSGIPDGLEARHPLEIERLYARKDFIGKSVGKKLMENCIAYAASKGHDVVWLGVWEHNHRAIRFYEKCGFTQFGAHPFLLGTDLQTDLLMKKLLHS